ncbi:MAG: 3-deoxy-7-phosphoheptulonate synthase [Thermoleophilia bacterium]|nr:3-deoxy-7-phosphoheptulonate synthase [Thermoleophilia bacterium]
MSNMHRIAWSVKPFAQELPRSPSRILDVAAAAHRPGDRRVVSFGDSGVRVGAGEFLVIAGPCSVESRDGIDRIARSVADAGAGMLRGGAWKPRTSPRSFQGLGPDALKMLALAREASGLPFVTEVLDPRDAEQAAQVADMLQIGARNMSNGALLREVARTGRPVLLKRGFGATVAELLDAADYLLAEGNEDVLLVERGIRTFEDSTRFTLDISAVPVLRERTHLPVIVDPSHPAGAARWVPDLARAAAAVGADGLMVEVHDSPQDALSDGEQSLDPRQFEELVVSLDRVLDAVGGRRSVPDARAEGAPVSAASTA